ncbi:MAG: ROK family protein [Actinomycetales bacterium]
MDTPAGAFAGNVVGIDVGGTTIKAGRFAPDGRLIERAALPTPAEGAEIAAAVAALGRRLCDDHTTAAAAVLPGVVDPAAGVVRWSANLAWRDVPLRSQLESELGVPVIVEHDVTAAALAEHDLTGTDLLFVGLGTGIGSAYILDGTVLRGATGLAGEIGHVMVRSDGEPCPCGRTGCLEVYASGSGVARRYAAAGGAAAEATAADVTAADVVARQGIEPLAEHIWAEAVDGLAVALAAATLLLDPARIVLGGGLAGAGERLSGPVTAALAAQLPWRPAPPVSISTLGRDAGIRGAALLAMRLVTTGVVTS